MRLPRKILPYGPTGLLLQWEQQIDPTINQGVHAYAAAISAHPAVEDSVPAYCSLLVVYNPQRIKAYDLQEWIYSLTPEPALETSIQLHKLPVVYGGTFGPDLEEVAQELGLTEKRLINLHASVTYRVYQLGYQPGFAFLGLTDKQLEVPRRSSPRTHVPAGSVGLAGRQTGVYPHEAPGGWQLIGRCPFEFWRSETTPQARLKPGDEVKFYPIKAQAWEAEKKKDQWGA